MNSRARLPSWLRRPVSHHGGYQSVASCITGHNLHTVCVEARCPNRGECFSSGTATFLIMGDVCTRRCRFCGVQKGIPAGLDNDEPRRIALAASAMNLRHIVITSVTRDDLPDGGAGHFAATILACRTTMPESTVEVLVPDFNGDTESLDAVLAARPDVLNHNIETVPRLYETIRPGARYGRSLKLLNHAAQHSMTAKSGIMAGLGESEEEVADVLNDLRLAGCSIVTIGQYLQPSDAQVPAAAYVSPEQFEKYERIGRDMGFAAIVSGPLVRSSYRAGELCAKQ